VVQKLEETLTGDELKVQFPKMNVVIFGQAEDAHVSLVAQHLDEAPLIFNLQDIIDRGEFSYNFANGKFNVFSGNKELSNVAGVWIKRLRKAGKQISLPVDEAHRDYSLSALRHFMSGFDACFPGAAWISHLSALQSAENKPYQQVIAHRVGFNIRDTFYASDSSQAKRFVENHNQVVVKPLARDFPVIDQHTAYAFGTKLVSPDLDYDGLSLAPAIFQKAIVLRARNF
jgi:hypothetical protein